MILSDFQPHGQSFGSHSQPSTVNHHEVFFLLPFFSELSQLTNQLTLLIFFISSHTIQHSPPPTHKQFLKMPEALCLHCWLQGSSLAFQHSLACHLASYSIGNPPISGLYLLFLSDRDDRVEHLYFAICFFKYLSAICVSLGPSNSTHLHRMRH